jgi:two-component system NtrC family response regulator
MSSDRPVLLMIDDDPGLRKQFKWSFEQYEVVVAGDREEGMSLVRRHEPDVVTLDLGLPPEPDSPNEGFRTLKEILTYAPATKIIALTGQSDRTNAVRAIGMGACDFMEKPFDTDLLNIVLARSFRLAGLERENRRLASQQGADAVAGLVTNDPAMLKACRLVERLAPTNATVLLLGESGTGKELLARALHEGSARKTKRFVAINCAAIPENLLESELFGYERGAFTGAVRQTPGKIETAHQGTLFLDEIGDLLPALQAKLLRFLQERKIERVGGREEIAVDVRVVCATHQNLRARIDHGLFREDLFYRLGEVVVNIPPLRDRQGDAVLLANAMLRRFEQSAGRGRLALRPDAIDAIECHAWPGNVRELENCIKRATIMAEGGLVTIEDLGLTAASEESIPNLRQVREEAERQAISRVMARADGNISSAADLLGVSRPTLYYLLNRYGMR